MRGDELTDVDVKGILANKDPKAVEGFHLALDLVDIILNTLIRENNQAIMKLRPTGLEGTAVLAGMTGEVIRIHNKVQTLATLQDGLTELVEKGRLTTISRMVG